MTSAEKPVYLIARGDEWLKDDVKGASPAFGTREAAEDHVATRCRATGESPTEFRVVEYTFSEAKKP